jgi:hypothetical protein
MKVVTMILVNKNQEDSFDKLIRKYHLPPISELNLSEVQLRDYLTENHSMVKKIYLKPQGDCTIITPLLNLCEVVLKSEVSLYFGNISEKVYDSFVEQFNLN